MGSVVILGARHLGGTPSAPGEAAWREVKEAWVERQRVGAYALCVDTADRVLLCRMSRQSRTPGTLTLPGGGVHHGEEPGDAVLRELTEETGLTGEIERLLGVHANVYDSGGDSIHGVRLLYQVAATGGSLRAETGDATTDGAAWVSLAELGNAALSAHARYALEVRAHTSRGRL